MSTEEKEVLNITVNSLYAQKRYAKLILCVVHILNPRKSD